MGFLWLEGSPALISWRVAPMAQTVTFSDAAARRRFQQELLTVCRPYAEEDGLGDIDQLAAPMLQSTAESSAALRTVIQCVLDSLGGLHTAPARAFWPALPGWPPSGRVQLSSFLHHIYPPLALDPTNPSFPPISSSTLNSYTIARPFDTPARAPVASGGVAGSLDPRFIAYATPGLSPASCHS